MVPIHWSNATDKLEDDSDSMLYKKMDSDKSRDISMRASYDYLPDVTQWAF